MSNIEKIFRENEIIYINLSRFTNFDVCCLDLRYKNDSNKEATIQYADRCKKIESLFKNYYNKKNTKNR